MERECGVSPLLIGLRCAGKSNLYALQGEELEHCGAPVIILDTENEESSEEK